MNPENTRWGRCLAITVKGLQCKNPAMGPHHRCFVPKHKAEIGMGRGVAQQLPSPVRDSGAPTDPDMPLDREARKAYIKDKLAQAKHNINQQEAC